MHRPLRWLIMLVALLLTVGLTACEQPREDTLQNEPGGGETVLGTPGAAGTPGDGIAQVPTNTVGVTTTTPLTNTTSPTDTTAPTDTGVITTTPPLTTTTPPAEATTAPSPDATVVAVDDGGTGTTPTDTQSYTVQAGDSLYSIAVATGTTVENLITLNSLDPNNTTLTVGQTLTVPGTGTAPTTDPNAVATPAPAVPTQAPQQGTNASGQRTHTVQNGEWIYATKC